MKGIRRIIYFSLSLYLFSCNTPSEKATREIQKVVYTIDSLYTSVTITRDAKLEKLLQIQANVESKNLANSKIYKELSNTYRKLNFYKQSNATAHKLVQLSRKSKDTFGIATGFRQLAMLYDDMGQYDSLYYYYDRSAKYYIKVDSFRLAGYNYLSLGITQKNAGDYIGAEESTIKTISYLKDLEEPRYLASAYNNLGLVARNIEKPKEALAYFEQVQEQRSKVKDKPYLQAGTYNNLGITYLSLEQYDKAVSWYDKGLEIKGLSRDQPKTYARLVANKGYALFKKGHTKNAFNLMILSYRLRDSIKDLLGKTTSALQLGEYYASLNEKEKASDYFKEALAYAKETNYNTGKLQSLQGLSAVAPAEEALIFAKAHIRLNDSLVQAERRIQDQFARIRFETDELEQEKTQAQKKTKQLSFTLFIAAILFLLGYIWMQRTNNRKERRFLEEKQEATEEMYNLMIAQQSKVDEGKKIEKERISKELHDGVLSKLFGVRLSLDMLNDKKGKEGVAERKPYLEELKELGQEIRKISHDLQDNSFLKETSFMDIMEGYVRDFCASAQLQYSFNRGQGTAWDALSIHKKIHLYRIIQEGLTNIQKHAKAQHIKTTFSSKDGYLKMVIEDDGKGIQKQLAAGIGLKNIQNRVVAISGDFTIEAASPKGTRLVLTFK